MNRETPPTQQPAVGADRARCLKPEEAAEFLSMSRTKIYELVATGELKSVKIGRSRRIPLSALDAFVQDLLDAG